MCKIKSFIQNFGIEIAVFLFFVLLHIPGLGRETFNTDVWKWKARTYDFGEGVFTLNFEKTIQKYHPGVTLMWIGTGAVKIYNLYYDLVFSHPPVNNDVSTVFELHLVQKFCLVVFIALALSFCIYVLKKEFGKRVALIFGILASIEPFYYALTRVFHLEGLMSILMLASFLWFYHYLQEKKFSRLVLSALFASLAFLTKTSAIYLIPFMLLQTFLHLKGQFFKPFGIWLILSILGFFLFWPAMWVMPGKALSTIYRGIFTIGMERGHTQIYFGNITEDPGIFYYLVVFALRSSIVLLVGLGGTFFSFKVANKKEKKFLLYTLLFALFYTIQITIPSKKLDRYILPAILALTLTASFFYAFLFSRLGKKKGLAILSVVMLFGIGTLGYLRQDYFSYFNPLFGGLRTGVKVLEPKWIIGQHKIVEYFGKKAPTDSLIKIVAFPEKYYTQIWPFMEEAGHNPVIKDLTPHAKNAHYFLYPVWQDESSQETRFDIEFADTIKLRGVPVWNVYKMAED
ncbi:hypothetical protein GF360_02305 [candidate division WWE3 bacterium]|nr:hypothetical protein [candidate division WWE3 bacterium]